MKILPISNNILKKANIRKFLPASLLALSILSAGVGKSCSKIESPQEKDVFEKQDSTENFNIKNDTTYNIIEHEIAI